MCNVGVKLANWLLSKGQSTGVSKLQGWPPSFDETIVTSLPELSVDRDITLCLGWNADDTVKRKDYGIENLLRERRRERFKGILRGDRVVICTELDELAMQQVILEGSQRIRL